MDGKSLGTTPISADSVAGFDAKYEVEYSDVQNEIAKLGSATLGGAVSWKKVAEQGEIILAQKSKDLQLAAYVAIAWQEMFGLEGLRQAIALLTGLLNTFWETAFPPRAKLRRRQNAFEWWHERACSLLKKIETPYPAQILESIRNAIETLDACAAERMPDVTPLRDMVQELGTIPVLAPKTEEKKVSPEPSQKKEPEPREKTEASQKKEPEPREKTDDSQKNEAKPLEKKDAAHEDKPSEKKDDSQKNSENTTKPAQKIESANSGEDLQALQKQFVSSALHYALSAHKANPEAALPWQILRLALWGKLTALPPETDGQTLIPPPDTDRLEGLYRLLKAGKYLDVALGAEDVFSSSLFCLDAQFLADAALDGLGKDFSLARKHVREETARFLMRFPGLEQLHFASGMPFANDETKAWIASLESEEKNVKSDEKNVEPEESRVSSSCDTVVAEAEKLAQEKHLDEALRLLEQSFCDSPAKNMLLRLAQLRLLITHREPVVAEALAQALLDELEGNHIETWDRDLSVRVLLVLRDAFVLAKNKEAADSTQKKIARLRPSAAIGWRRI